MTTKTIKAKNRFDLLGQLQILERKGFKISVRKYKLDNRGISTGEVESYTAYKSRNDIGLEQIQEIIIYP